MLKVSFVNITSGMDLGFDEFNVVGDTVGSFASEDATIVVGTSLVPEMSNEIRVTIVATGLGDVVAAEPVVIVRPSSSSTTSPSSTACSARNDSTSTASWFTWFRMH